MTSLNFSRGNLIQIKKITVYMFLGGALALTNTTQAMAEGFAVPEEISNRQKAHFNIAFTGEGDGSEEEEDDSCSVGSDGPGNISKDFSLGTDPKERRVNLIKALMAAYGLTPEQAAGPVGNFMEESGGDHLPPDVNQGGAVGPPNSSSLGYGWAQWSGGRKTAIAKYINDTGYKTAAGHATDAADFGYMAKELAGSYKSTITDLKKQESPEDAALSFHTTFERSGDNMAQIQERATAARQAFNEYKQSSGGSTSEGGGGCSGTTTSVNYGEVTFPLKGSKSIVTNPGIFANGTTQIAGHPYTAYDIMTPGGTEVVAFMTGKVSYFFNDTCNGDSVVIWNQTAKIGISYLHMQPGSIKPKMNEEVKVGETVGIVGRGLPDCGGDHLHIDASVDKIRLPCSRSGCSIQSHFRSMGKELFETYQALPN